MAEMAVARGFATVVRHRHFEERSEAYEALLAAEQRAMKGKKGLHSAKDPPVAHLNDLTVPPPQEKRNVANKARAFLPFLQKQKRLPALVDYVLSGHRLKVMVAKEMCEITFSLAGVRCPGRDEPFSEEAIALMRRKVMQHDVEVEVETVDKAGAFIGSMWVGGENCGAMLLAQGLAKLHTTFQPDRTAEGAALMAAEGKAKQARLRVWEKYVEGQEAEESAAAQNQSSWKENTARKVTPPSPPCACACCMLHAACVWGTG